MLHSIVYISASNPDLEEKDLQDILSISKINNKETGITGVLIYGRGAFIQVLEGKKEDVMTLYNKIYTDERHIRITRLMSKDIEKRNFPTWLMGFKRVDNFDEEGLLENHFDFKDPAFETLAAQNTRILRLLQTFKQYNYV